MRIRFTIVGCIRIVLFGFTLNRSLKIPTLYFFETIVEVNSFGVISLHSLTLFEILLLVELQHFDPFGEIVDRVGHDFNEIL